MGKRARNPRVVAVEMLATLKRLAASQRNRWTVTGTVIESGEPTYREQNGAQIKVWGPSIWRKRRQEEYPESDPREWESLWAYADDMVRQAEALRAHALAQWQNFPPNEGYTLTRKESGR